MRRARGPASLVSFFLQEAGDAHRQEGDEDAGDDHARGDGREGVAQADVQKGRHQRPRPGPGPRQGDGHEKQEPRQAVLPHQAALEM